MMASTSDTQGPPHMALPGDRPGADAPAIYLDTLPLHKAEVGYSTLGMYGSLGYEGKQVMVQGQPYQHALSTHPPAHLMFQLDGRFRHFSCQVALNDDVPAGLSHADFSVLADGRLVAHAACVEPGAPPRTLSADVRGAHWLALLVRTNRWDFCHAVWLDPQLDEMGDASACRRLSDCLGRVEMTVPSCTPQAAHCIATVVSAGFAGLLDDMLGSLLANGGCQDAALVVFVVDPDEECMQVVAKYGATVVRCVARAPLNMNVKSALYSAARVVDAQYFLCLDADMLVLGDLRPVFAALEACPDGSILACREANQPLYRNLEHVLSTLYGGQDTDLPRLLGQSSGEDAYPLVVNDGLFAGSRAALLQLDSVIRGWSQAREWIDERPDIAWRNQFVFNLAMAHMACGVELDATYNVQLNSQDVEMRWAGGRVQGVWQARMVRVLHFNGLGRQKYPEWRNLFGRVEDPLVGPGDGDGYAAFMAALRPWVGRYGLRSLAWSFYGTTDGRNAQVRDPTTLPLLALLHYLIRANGCVRVLEAGTAKGVSAACMASAVVSREGGQVVTFDPAPHAERVELWAALPAAVSTCIEQRTVGSLEGMAAALASGERYEAALLDSLHSAEHVWSEFQLAVQLVCPGGLILIHDPRYAHGTVEQALQRIEAVGYGVVRLWTADAGIREDDQLGLAVIENRCRIAVSM